MAQEDSSRARNVSVLQRRATGAALAFIAVLMFAGLAAKLGVRPRVHCSEARWCGLPESLAAAGESPREAIAVEDVQGLQVVSVDTNAPHHWEAPKASAWIFDDGSDILAGATAPGVLHVLGDCGQCPGKNICNLSRVIESEPVIEDKYAMGGSVASWGCDKVGSNSTYVRNSETGVLYILEPMANSVNWAMSTAGPTTELRSIKLFCFAIFRATGVEAQLIGEVVKANVGLVGCDDWAIVTNVQTNFTTGLNTTVNALVIDHKLSPSHGDSFNVEEFTKAWQAVAADGRYKHADFVVKVDPDTVFFPERLRDELNRNGISKVDPAFFANCVAEVDWQERTRFMFGPVEVFSRAAIDAYFRKGDQCRSLPRAADDYEESFMTRCLLQLDVTFNTEMKLHLLSDNHCRHSEGASSCVGDSVAFHNFSTVHDWFKCWNEARDPEDATEVVRKQK